jgi:hypothetical protein
VIGRRHTLIAIWFAAVVWFIPDQGFIPGAIAGGIFLADLSPALSAQLSRETSRWPLIGRWLVAGLLIGYSAIGTYKWLESVHPGLSADTLQESEWIQSNTPTDARFLAVLPSEDEAEWLPGLFRRTPVLGHWGAEWLGTYDQQFDLYVHAQNCAGLQSEPCIDELLSYGKLRPDLVVTVGRTSAPYLFQSMQESGRWTELFENQSSAVWGRLP